MPIDIDNEGELLNPGLDFLFKKIFVDVRNVDVTRDFLASTLNLQAQELSALTFINTELLREHANDKKGVLDVRIKTSSKEKKALKMIAKENPMVEKAVGILEFLSGDEKIRREAFYREREIRDEISRMTSARNEGKVEGETTKALAIASKMLKRNRPIDEIIEDTGLTLEEIKHLRCVD